MAEHVPSLSELEAELSRLLDPDNEEFAHPRTGERVLVAGRGFASTAERHAEFTPEGGILKHPQG